MYHKNPNYSLYNYSSIWYKKYRRSLMSRARTGFVATAAGIIATALFARKVRNVRKSKKAPRGLFVERPWNGEVPWQALVQRPNRE